MFLIPWSFYFTRESILNTLRKAHRSPVERHLYINRCLPTFTLIEVYSRAFSWCFSFLCVFILNAVQWTIFSMGICFHALQNLWCYMILNCWLFWLYIFSAIHMCGFLGLVIFSPYCLRKVFVSSILKCLGFLKLVIFNLYHGTIFVSSMV